MSVSGIEAPTGLGFNAGLPGLSTGSVGSVGATSTSGTTGSAFAEALQSAGITPPTVEAPNGPTAAAGTTAPTDVKGLVTNGIDGLEAMHDTTDRLAVQAATGDLGAIHQYTLAATEMSVATQLTVAVRNKAVEAFNEIMRMQV